MIKLQINGKSLAVDADPEMPLLYVLREILGLTGTKYGCGVGLCGACTVHLDGEPVRSCATPVSAAIGQSVTTIEGLANDEQLHPVQMAWLENKVPQCGFCQSGQIMSATALLQQHAQPTDDQIDNWMQGNICRCGTYSRIKKAIKKVAQSREG